jgi:hypothetical protein
MVWRHEMGLYYRNLSTIIPQHGPITWESSLTGDGRASA